MFTRTLDASRLPVGHRRQDAVLFQRGGNLLCPKAVQCHLINSANNGSGYLIHDSMLGIIRVFYIPIWRLSHRFPGISLNLVADAPLFADIARVPLVE